MADDYWIHEAIRHPGSLHRWAAEHGALDADGKVDLKKAEREARKEREPARAHRLREINLARTLRKLRR